MGPLHGVRVVELAGLGPAPFCGMLLADLGADVVLVEREAARAGAAPPKDPLQRSRRSIVLDLKHPDGLAALLDLVADADVLIEGFRPGVAERLGFGPDACFARNPRLVYGRMTGWGQDGPLAPRAGHDLNYVAASGALHLIGPRGGKPVPPLNLVGDFGGGGMLLAVGVLAALHAAKRSGRGQVIDAAMIDGAAAQLAMQYGFRAEGRGEFADATGESLLAGGAPYYDTYETKDGRYLAIAAIEPPFYAEMLRRLGLDPARYAGVGWPALDASARERWPALREAIATAVRTRTRDEWAEAFAGADACVSPVLALAEAERDPHHVARGTHVAVDGVVQNAPAPRFGRTPLDPPRAPRVPGADTAAVLADAGYSPARIAALRASGAAAFAPGSTDGSTHQPVDQPAQHPAKPPTKQPTIDPRTPG
jgi:alpha-methylacyl-CoA racemase